MASRLQRRTPRIRYSVYPYNVWAVSQLRGPRSGDDSETYTYIYCIRLPCFQCQTTQKFNSLQQRRFPPLSPEQVTAIRNDLSVGRDPWGLREYLAAQSYAMVKIGISTDPARRLYEIMRGLEGFGAQDTEFSTMYETDSPDNAVENGKLENKIVFIKKCRDIGDAESKIRDLIGIKLGQPFRDQFTANLGDDKQSALDQVGMTEWVLIRTNFFKAIQRQYRENWPSIYFANHQRGVGILLGPCIQTGQEFYRQLRSFSFRVYQQMPQLTSTHDVEIKFPPNYFTFTLTINSGSFHTNLPAKSR